MYEKVMKKDFTERQKLGDLFTKLLLADAEKISGALWTDTSYTDISKSLKYKRMNEKEIYHYEDVRELLTTAKWLSAVALMMTLMGFHTVGWRKVWNASLASFLLLGAIAGVWMLIYWRGLFRALHWLVFQDDSWILPTGSYSLGLFPHKVWQTAGNMIAAYIFIILAVGLAIQVIRRKTK